MGRLSEKLIAALLVLFLFVYFGYQFFVYYYQPLQYETAFRYSVSHSVEATGVIIRSEIVIDQQSEQGVENSVYTDGTRVSRGQAVAEYYASSVSDRQIHRMREIQEEIAALTEAQNPTVSNYTNAEYINREIRDRVGLLNQMSSTGRFADMDEIQPALISSLNKKQIAVGKEDNYQLRIDQLLAEYEALDSNTTSTSIQVANAPAAGYFVKNTDGMEHLSPDILESYGMADYKALLENASPTPSSNMVGKVVTSENWYLVVAVPGYDTQFIQPGWKVELDFESVDGRVPGTVQNVLTDGADDDIVLVIHSNHVNGDLLNLRLEPVDIYVEQYSGLRISTSSLRFQNEEIGVYVASRNIVRFKKVDPIYEETGFIISRESEDLETVNMFDQIITRGIDLYDGKVIE